MFRFSKFTCLIGLNSAGKSTILQSIDFISQQMHGNISDWLERAPYEIPLFFQKNDTHLLLIKGFGLISYDRDLTEMAKKISILENSCRLLALSANL